MKKNVRKYAIWMITMLLVISTLYIPITASNAEPLTERFYQGTAVIDGIIDPIWNKLPEIEMTPITALSNNTAPDGLSGYFKGMWSETTGMIYFLAVVEDATMLTLEQCKALEGSMWASDLMMSSFWFGDASATAPDVVAQIDSAGTPRSGFTHTNKMEYASTRSETGYIIEFSIKVREYCPDFALQADSVFRFDIFVSDNTDGTVKRMGAISWNSEDGVSTNNNGKGLGNIVLDGRRPNELGDHPAPVTLEGAQVTAISDGKYSIRFIGTVSSLEFDAVGFDIKAAYGQNEVRTFHQNIYKVYTSVIADGDVYRNEQLGGKYLYALEIRDIPVEIGSIDFSVTPYAVDMSGTDLCGTLSSVVCNAGILE